MKTLPLATGLLLLMCALGATPSAGVERAGAQVQGDYAALQARAEGFEREGSWEKALIEWRKAGAYQLSEAQARWAAYRRAECSWRSRASTREADDTDLEAARKELEALQARIERPELRDLTWARIEESLGDFWWTRAQHQDWGQAWPHYAAALDWWSGTADVEAARARYLGMVWRLAWPLSTNARENWYVRQIPLEVLENAVRIAQNDSDRARAQYLYALCVRNNGGDNTHMRRAFAMLESAVKLGKGTPWYDDALFTLAEWHESPGQPELDEEGQWRTAPDYVQALALYRRYTEEFQKGQVPRWDNAREAIERITRVEISLVTPCAFLPGSEQGFTLAWRNASKVELALYRVDLTQAVKFGAQDQRTGAQWIESVSTSGLERVQGWSFETHDDGRHVPGSSEQTLGGKDGLALPAPLTSGAYLLEANSGGKRARELVLVGRTLLVLKSAGERALVWCCDALTSEPVAGARVVLHERYYDGQVWRWRSSTGTTGPDGTYAAEVEPRTNWGELVAFATQGERAAVSHGTRPYSPDRGEPWKLYAVTDRPAYRPEDTVQWKVSARVERAGQPVTPANAKLAYTIRDPHGAEVKQGELTLNAFGSAWAEFALNASLPLGEYNVQFEELLARGTRSIGGATLFRLEEYKLPEFEVTLATPEVQGRKQIYRLGDRVEADLVARTYFGAPVGGAEVEVIVWQRPYARRWEQAREFPWCYEPDDSWRWGRWNKGSQVQRITSKTDAEGHARVAFDTPEGAGQDFEYTLEARVTDASRREIRSSQVVRVSQKGYAVHIQPDHQLHRPGEQVQASFEARDANDNPLVAEGRVKLWRRAWTEVWIDPQGQEQRGAALELARNTDALVPLENRPGWRLVRSGYESEEVATSLLRTDAKGQASWTISVPKEGYYDLGWSSRDDRRQPITAQASFWVASESTRATGYRSGGLELVIDKDTFRLGEKAAVMIASDTTNRWVLLTVEGERLHSFQVVHVEGSAKLVELAIGEQHLPNAWLSVFSAARGLAYSDTKEIVVPPTPRFLSVELQADAEEHEPGTPGSLTVITKDSRGEPVSAEVTLTLVDESVLALQSEYAGDPRPFFFGQRREHRIQTSSSVDSKPFRRLVRDEHGGLRDARLAWAEDSKDRDLSELDDSGRSDSGIGGGGGGKKFGSLRGMSAPRGQLAADAAAPMSKAAESMDERSAGLLGMAKNEAAPTGGEAGQEPVVQVRSDFRETALWKPDLVTDAQGRGQVSFTYPESLTRWKAGARVLAQDSRAGFATATTRTRKPLTARLAAPRFFVVGDECVVSALIDDQTSEALHTRVELRVEGLELLAAPELTVDVPANGQRRLDWKLRAVDAGRAKLVLSVRAGALSDALQKTYPVHAHGIDAQVARALRLADGELSFDLELPAARRKDSTSLEIRVAPSLAVTMLDALPYLIDYPYGCTEQTLSRFLPAAIVAKTLRDRGLSAEEAMTRAFGGIEPESAGPTHPKGKKSLELLTEMTRQSLERLYDFQHADGGWGWWKEGDSDHWMSAYVVWGLSLARDAGLDVDLGRLTRGAEYLKVEIVEEEGQADLAAWMLHAIAAHSKDAREDDRAYKAFMALWEQKDQLNAYGKALFALAAQSFGRTDRAKTLLENLHNGVRIDETPDVSRVAPGSSQHHDATMKTAHWGADGVWWHWSDSSVETTAFALRALMAIDPQDELVEPVMSWLVQNRRGAQWSSTRDTAISILALDEYLSRSKELGRDVEYELSVNGKSLGRTKLAAKDLLTAPGRFTLGAEGLRDGANNVKLRILSGSGPLYVSARARFFSQEEPVPPRGSQIFVQRQYYKLESRPTLLKGPAYDKLALLDGGSVKSGDRIEVVLTIEAKNDLEYLLFEDLKPAGFEAVQVKSGEWLYARELKSGEVAYRFEGSTPPAVVPDPDDFTRYTDRQRGVHQELRDRNVALFVDKLAQGVWEIRYTLRAEAPGRFHALPVLGQAMYVPEVRCNGGELRVTVEERATSGG